MAQLQQQHQLELDKLKHGEHLKQLITNLFTVNIRHYANAYRGRDQFSKVNGLYLFEITSSHWPPDDKVYWSK